MRDDDTPIVLCNRVDDMPIPFVSSSIKYCTGGCLERVWVAHSDPKARPMCMQCAGKLLATEPGPHKVEALTAAQAFDVLRWVGQQKRKQ